MKKNIYFLLLLLFFIINSCTKDEILNNHLKEPIITNVVTNITGTTATCGGNIVKYGAASKARGVIYYYGNNTPDTVFAGTGNGEFVCELTNLIPNRQYNIMAFGINSKRITTGPIIQFLSTLEGGADVTDVDGNIYHTITVGNQVWMKENLKTVHYNNGDLIPNAIEPSVWEASNEGLWCDFNNEPINGITYGKLYNWVAVNDSRKLCPEGWHVPSNSEWEILNDSLGNENIVTVMKVRLGGYAEGTGSYLEQTGYWWSSSQINDLTGYARQVGYNEYNEGFSEYSISKKAGLSVRCIKD